MVLDDIEARLVAAKGATMIGVVASNMEAAMVHAKNMTSERAWRGICLMGAIGDCLALCQGGPSNLTKAKDKIEMALFWLNHIRTNPNLGEFT